MNVFIHSLKVSLAQTTTRVLRRLLPCATVGIGLTLASQASALETQLPVNGVLLVGQRLVDPNCYYHLDMQSDANLVIYAGGGTTHPIWADNQSGNTGGAFGNAKNQAYVILQADGNLVEYVPSASSDYVAQAIWASNTDNGRQELLAMQVDGNLVIYPTNVVASAETAIWSSKTSGTIHPAPPGVCPLQSSYTQLHGDMKVSGTELTFLETETWTQCGETCVEAGDCTAFEFDYDQWDLPGVCSLYEGATTLAPASKGTTAMSGTIVGL